MCPLYLWVTREGARAIANVSTNMSTSTVVNPGFPRRKGAISQGGGHPENFIKMKWNGPRRRCASLAPPQIRQYKCKCRVHCPLWHCPAQHRSATIHAFPTPLAPCEPPGEASLHFLIFVLIVVEGKEEDKFFSLYVFASFDKSQNGPLQSWIVCCLYSSTLVSAVTGCPPDYSFKIETSNLIKLYEIVLSRNNFT